MNMNHTRLLILGLWVLVLGLTVVMVSAQGAMTPPLEKEVGCAQYRCWYQQQARLAEIDLTAEVGSLQWHIWQNSQPTMHGPDL